MFQISRYEKLLFRTLRILYDILNLLFAQLYILILKIKIRKIFFTKYCTHLVFKYMCMGVYYILKCDLVSNISSSLNLS